MSDKTDEETAQRTARSSADLLRLGLIRADQLPVLDEVGETFSIAVPSHLANLMNPADPDDPIAKQFVPSADELVNLSDELIDPIGDSPFTVIKGITHRYPDRLLLKPVHLCPVYCRFCFRRENVGRGAEVLSPTELEAALNYIREHEEVWEVILSGGDPFILSNQRLSYIIKALNDIPHVEVIRFHTKYPVAEPARITNELVKILRDRAALYVVVHCNHPRELTMEATKACATLIDGGIPVLSQSVLLADVNDDPETMSALMRAFVKRRIKPYYIHHLDLARGTSHFRTSIEHGS